MRLEIWKPILLAAGLWAVESLSASAQPQVTFTTLVSFKGTNGSVPQDGLMESSDGNFYGTTYGGGTGGGGTVFKMAPGGALTTLYDFSPGSTNGCYPNAGLVQGPDGCLYGTTQEGGDVSEVNTNGYGTIFKTTTNGELTTVYSFSNAVDGAIPLAGLVLGGDGNLYGTTAGGEPDSPPIGTATVFQLTTNATLTTLASFNHPIIGSDNTIGPDAALVQGSDGNFYGTTLGGSVPGTGFPTDYGMVFKLVVAGPSAVLTNLLQFQNSNGANPRCSLVQGADGDFYGTTANGSANGTGGTVFKVTTNGTLTSLYSFTSGHPRAGLVRATDGNFYGVATVSDGGTIFQITPSGRLTTLVLFNDTNSYTDGYAPRGPLVQGADGNFYGSTSQGGAAGDGTIFRLSVPLQPVFQSVVQTNGMFAFAWSTVATNTYQLQYCTDPTQTNWSNLNGPIIATSGMLSATDIIGTNSQRFYRVVLSP
jgi:uncharacterized repeat protein (TIGR03803 family)